MGLREFQGQFSKFQWRYRDFRVVTWGDREGSQRVTEGFRGFWEVFQVILENF